MRASIGLFVLLMAAPALAETSVEARLESAQAAILEAQEHLAAGRYREGIAAYERAHVAFPEPRNLYVIATAWERVEGACAEGLSAWDRFLADCGECGDREGARARRAALARRCVARLRIESEPVGAEAFVGARAIGRTPVTVEVEPGARAVRLVLPGHTEARKQVEAERGRTVALSVALTPAASPEPAAVEAAARSAPDNTGAWISFGVAGAGVAVGTVFVVLMQGSVDDFDDAGSRDAARSFRDEADRHAIIAQVSYGVAAAALLTGFLLYDWSDDGPGVRPTVGPGGAGLVGRF